MHRYKCRTLFPLGISIVIVDGDAGTSEDATVEHLRTLEYLRTGHLQGGMQANIRSSAKSLTTVVHINRQASLLLYPSHDLERTHGPYA